MITATSLLVFTGGGGPDCAAASVSSDRDVSIAKPPIPYSEYVRIVSRRGVGKNGSHRKKVAKGPKTHRAAEKVGAVGSVEVKDSRVTPPGEISHGEVPESKGGGALRPTIVEIREILRSSRDLSGMDLRGMDLAGLDLSNVVLANCDLYMANLSGSRLDGANLRGASLEMANLRGASLKGANLSGAGLFMADLEGANLEGADLTGVYAVGANLRGAVLAGASIRGGLFTNTIMGEDLPPMGDNPPGGEQGLFRRVKGAMESLRWRDGERDRFIKF